MASLYLEDVYYLLNEEFEGYLNIFFVTNKGVLKVDVASVNKIDLVDLKGYKRLEELDKYKSKHGGLMLTDIRNTYDNDLYVLLSQNLLLLIEYIPSSDTQLSKQSFRIIDEISYQEVRDFMELEMLDPPFLS